MIPTHLRTAARERIAHIGRRDFLIMGASAVAMKAADVAFDKLVVDRMLDAEPPLPVPHDRHAYDFARDFRTTAPAEIQLPFDALHFTGEVPDHLAGRTTEMVRSDDDMIVVKQGMVSGKLLWNGPLLGSLRNRPDRSFGEFRASKIYAATMTSKPSFAFNRVIVNGKPRNYFDAIVRGPNGRVFVFTSEDPATPARNPRSTAGATSRGSA